MRGETDSKIKSGLYLDTFVGWFPLPIHTLAEMRQKERK